MALPNRITFTVGLPTEEGFVGRKCSSESCGRYFKVHEESLTPNMHCPYCGEDFPTDELLTEEQARYATDVVQDEAVALVEKELQDMLSRAFRGSKSVTYRPDKPRPRPLIKPPQERIVDSELRCPDCDTLFQVDGIFGYCPGCKSEILRLYDANLAVIRSEIAQSSNPERALRHAYSDLVSTFEMFCRKEAKRLGVEQGRFQNLDHTRKLFREHVGVDFLQGFDLKEVRQLKRVFAKRNVYEHNEGVVNERYVKQIPEDSAFLGSKAPLSFDELESTAEILRNVLERLVAAR
jgi:hypothetical protein